jgi:hypothetical protein
MQEHGTDKDMELLEDKSLWGGIGGLATTMGLAQWSHLASLVAACCTITFMVIRIYQITRK